MFECVPGPVTIGNYYSGNLFVFAKLTSPEEDLHVR